MIQITDVRDRRMNRLQRLARRQEREALVYVEAPVYKDLRNVKSVFLAGGISGCEPWQDYVTKALKDLDIAVLNPRRKNFPMDDPGAAFTQIKWEHDNLRKADSICFWFCKETECPIVLYELGAWSMTSKPIVIGIDPNYSRKQDVEIQTKLVRPDVKVVYSLDDMIELTRKMLSEIEE